MKRWVVSKNEHAEVPEIDAFLADLIAVCKNHRMWIGHEDWHGAFEVVTEPTDDWLMLAHDCRSKA